MATSFPGSLSPAPPLALGGGGGGGGGNEVAHIAVFFSDTKRQYILDGFCYVDKYLFV